MKKLTVCYLCNHGVGSDGAQLLFVEPLQQLALLQNGQLETTVCFECFCHSYRHLVKDLKDMARRLKTQFDVTELPN